jgi:hypothetical protein
MDEGEPISSKLHVITPSDEELILEELFRTPLSAEGPFDGLCENGSGFFQNSPFVFMEDFGGPNEALLVTMQQAHCDGSGFTSNFWRVPIADPLDVTVEPADLYPFGNSGFACAGAECYRLNLSTRIVDNGDPDVELRMTFVDIIAASNLRFTADLYERTTGPGNACDGFIGRTFSERIFFQNGKACVYFQTEDCDGMVTDDIFCIDMGCLPE